MAVSKTDLRECASPVEVCRALRLAAWECSLSADECRNSWQDDEAGRIWVDIAIDFERLANKIERKWDALS